MAFCPKPTLHMAFAGGFSSIAAEALTVWHKSKFLITGGWHVSQGTAYIATVYIGRGFQQGSTNHSFFESWLLQLNGFGLSVRFYDFIIQGVRHAGVTVHVQNWHRTADSSAGWVHMHWYQTCTGTRHAHPYAHTTLGSTFFIFYSYTLLLCTNSSSCDLYLLVLAPFGICINN